MQIIKYESNGNTVSCGFKENTYVVYAQTGVKEGYTKSMYLQEMYEEIKHALDYERNLFNLGKTNSITTEEEGEDWIPEMPKVDKLIVSTDKSSVLFDKEDVDKAIEVSAVAYDQYGEAYDGNVVITVDSGIYENGVLTISKPEADMQITITAEIEETQESKVINVNLVPPVDIEILKKDLILKSKVELETFLAENPIQFKDGKYYSITQEKQNLLSNAIAVYQMKVQAGLPAEITWNSTGEPCTTWAIEDVIELALMIAGYVEPLVSKQQNIELDINACTTEEELEQIVIDYETI